MWRRSREKEAAAQRYKELGGSKAAVARPGKHFERWAAAVERAFRPRRKAGAAVGGMLVAGKSFATPAGGALHQRRAAHVLRFHTWAASSAPLASQRRVLLTVDQVISSLMCMREKSNPCQEKIQKSRKTRNSCALTKIPNRKTLLVGQLSKYHGKQAYLFSLAEELLLEVLHQVTIKILPAKMGTEERCQRIFNYFVRLSFTYSPAVALTVKTPPWMWRRETSKVPPPRS